MSLVTRCATCGTAFRVHRTQLAARGGKVRCGKCGTVFDGIAGLLEEGAGPLVLEPSPQLGLFDPSRRPQAPPPKAAKDEAPPPFMAREQPVRRRLLWGLLAFIAFALLVWQSYRSRTEITEFFPESRPALETACRALGCDVPLPRRPKLISIESSEIHADGRRESLVVLHAVLRNRARFPQQYPAMELTFTDETQRPVLRRVLFPLEYLRGVRSAQRIAQGMEAGGEESLALYLDTSSVRPKGYRLCLHRADCSE